MFFKCVDLFYGYMYSFHLEQLVFYTMHSLLGMSQF